MKSLFYSFWVDGHRGSRDPRGGASFAQSDTSSNLVKLALSLYSKNNHSDQTIYPFSHLFTQFTLSRLQRLEQVSYLSLHSLVQTLDQCGCGFRVGEIGLTRSVTWTSLSLKQNLRTLTHLYQAFC